MKLNTQQFCYLSSAPAWLAWLHDYSADLYRDLIEHLRRKTGCRANQAKMLEMLNQIMAQPDGIVQLETFLRKSFPHVLIPDEHQQARPKAKIDPVFPDYKPGLLTLPRRKILERHDVPNLEEAVTNFLADKRNSDYVIVGDRAYIEYLPAALASLHDKIPANNWLVRTYKQSSSVQANK
jgi:hypothetical protein